MKNIISKIMMAVVAAALALSAIPVSSAFAADDPPKGELTVERMEKIWARGVRIYERMGGVFGDIDAHIAKLQSLIDKAAANGKDVTALQTALDEYEAALKDSKPIYDELGEIITAHNGFDADGKVTNEDQARATLQSTREKGRELKAAMDGKFKAWREALKEFRKANQPKPKP